MPFQSEKQRRYLHANHPEIAKRWERDYADGGITRIPFFTGAQADTKKGKAMSPGTSASGGTRYGGGGGDGPPSVINKPKGPTQAEIEAERQKKAGELQQRQAQQYSDFYGKFKGDTKKKTDYLSRLLKNDPLYETYKNKGLLDWNNIKSFDQDKRKTAEEIEKMKSSAWGYTRPWTSDESLFIANIDKFDPTWTPGWTGDSDQERLNERIAETIGHEARHQVLGNVNNRGEPWGWQGQTMWTGDPYSQDVETELTMSENSPYSKYMDEGGLKYQGYSTPMTSHELLTRMGDYQSYNDPRVYEDIYGNVHGWMPEHLTSDVANKFYDAAEQFTKDTKARTVGEKYENIDPVMVEGLKKAYPDENIDEALKEMSTKDVMDLLQENYQYDEDKKEMMEDDTEAMSALTTPIEGLGGFSYADTKLLLDKGYDPVEVGTWKNNEGQKLIKSLQLKKGGVARKKYSTGGILDITGEEEITTEEGNDISLVDESETGVSTLFKEKNNDYAIQGGGPNYLGKQPEVTVPKYWKSSPEHPDTELAYITQPEKQVLIDLNLHGGLEDGEPNTGPNGIISLQGDMGSIGGGSKSSGSDGNGGETNRERGIRESYKEAARKSSLAKTIAEGPGSDAEKYDTDLVGMTEPEKYNARRNMIKSKYTATSPQRKSALTDNYTQEKNRLEKAMKGSFLKTLALAAVGIPPTLGNVVSFNPFGEKKLTGLGPQAYELQQLKNQHIADLTSMKDDLLAGVDTTNPNEMRNLEETTNFTEIMNDLEELTKVKDEDEDTKGDGPEVPVVAPVTEEIEDSYAMAGDWLQGYRDLKAKQALSASLQEKWADERQWQQETMFANSGGLANLFRVKNQ